MWATGKIINPLGCHMYGLKALSATFFCLHTKLVHQYFSRQENSAFYSPDIEIDCIGNFPVPVTGNIHFKWYSEFVF
jgi:hypothetical protein